MDLSKLPRMSHTPSPPPPNPAETAPQPVPPDAAFPVIVPPTASEAAPVHCNQCGAANPAGSRFCSGCGNEFRAAAAVAYAEGHFDRSPGIGAEVWLSAILGVILMLVGMSFAKWALVSMAGATYDTGLTWGAPIPDQPNQHAEGSPIGYWELSDGVTALQDMAIFLFGLAMVLEAVVLVVVHSRVRSKRPLLFFALAITLIATALNLIVAGKLFAASVLPFLSLLCVGFGGYIAAYEWKLLKYFRPLNR
jgi:hypothetical protein